MYTVGLFEEYPRWPPAQSIMIFTFVIQKTILPIDLDMFIAKVLNVILDFHMYIFAGSVFDL